MEAKRSISNRDLVRCLIRCLKYTVTMLEKLERGEKV